MKNFIKSSLILYLLIIVSTCSKDDNNSEKPIDNAVPTETIALENLDINFEDLTAVTLDGESDVDENGGFNASVNNNVAEELPILFMKDDEVMFGYYSKTGANNTVSIDDILMFFISLNPSVSVQGFTNSNLMELIKSQSNYLDIKDDLTSILNSNLSPLKNDAFVSSIAILGDDLVNNFRNYYGKSVKNKEADDKGEFKFTYKRDGKIEWEKKVPLYATVGFEIKNKTNSSVVYGPHFLEPKSVVMSPTSLIGWIYDRYFNDDEFDEVTNFNLQEEGEYSISFSNGNSTINNSLDSKVAELNNKMLVAKLVSFAIPIGFKAIAKKTECSESLAEALASAKGIPTKILILQRAPTKLELIDFIEEVYVSVFNAMIDCVEELPWHFYFKKLIQALDLVRKVGNIAELVLFSSDYYDAQIRNEEFRYFYDGKSYGELNYVNNSGFEFNGVEGSEHLYQSTLKEKETIYEVHREDDVTFYNKKESLILANDMPFKATKTEGDGTLKQTNPFITNEGILSIDFIMGKEDSEFEIEPMFKPIGINAKEYVFLKSPTDSIPIYEAAVLGLWIREYVTKEIAYEVTYEENGGGFYYQADFDWTTVPGGRDAHTHSVNWSIYKKDDGRYYLNTGIFLWGVRPTDPLTYPPTFTNEYDGVWENVGELMWTYTKVE